MIVYIMTVTYSEKCYLSDGTRSKDLVYSPIVRYYKTYKGWRKHYDRFVANVRQPVDFTVNAIEQNVGDFGSSRTVARLIRTTDLHVMLKFAHEPTTMES